MAPFMGSMARLDRMTSFVGSMASLDRMASFVGSMSSLVRMSLIADSDFPVYDYVIYGQLSIYLVASKHVTFLHVHKEQPSLLDYANYKHAF